MQIGNSTKSLVFQAITEDAWSQDETTRSIIEPSSRCLAQIVGKQPGIFSGREVLMAIEELFTPNLKVIELMQDGRPFEKGQILAKFEGTTQTVLAIERTLLNFWMHLCGVASLTSRFVGAVRPLSTRVLATRKTTPGLRQLELAAVTHGGGYIHRRSLSDGVLIKENHLVFVDAESAIRRAREKHSPLHGVEIEIQDLDLIRAVLSAKPDIILLDNLSPEQVRTALGVINGQARVEVSGGINLDTIRKYAELGVDYISVGQITHSAPACDLSLDICRDL